MASICSVLILAGLMSDGLIVHFARAPVMSSALASASSSDLAKMRLSSSVMPGCLRISLRSVEDYIPGLFEL